MDQGQEGTDSKLGTGCSESKQSTTFVRQPIFRCRWWPSVGRLFRFIVLNQDIHYRPEFMPVPGGDLPTFSPFGVSVFCQFSTILTCFGNFPRISK
jgi:hypothetical protein